MPPTNLTPERLAELKALHGEASPGEWHGPHLSDNSTSCNCCSIVSEGLMGGVCTIHVDNQRPIVDGGNDAPPLGEAKANGDLIRELHNAFPALARELERAWASEATLREENERLRGEAKRATLREVADHIASTWGRAYPEELVMFADLPRGEGDVSDDARTRISAMMGRHIAKCLIRELREWADSEERPEAHPLLEFVLEAAADAAKERG